MTRSLIVSSILLLAASGCSRGAEQTSAANTTKAEAVTVETTGSPGTIGAYGPGLVPTSQFVEQAAISDMFEVASAKIALTRSRSAAIRTFAQQMIADHGATTAKLKAALASNAVAATAPTALDDRRAKLIDALQKAEPGKFDELYLDQQGKAHREALGLIESYATHGDDAMLKAFAAATKPTIQMHLEMVSKLDHGGADDAKPAA